MENTVSGDIKMKSIVCKVILCLTWETCLTFCRKPGTQKGAYYMLLHAYLSQLDFFLPFTIRVDCLFQKLWEHGLQWDCELSEDLVCEKLWHQWCKDLSDIENLKISRCYHEALVWQLKCMSSAMPVKVHIMQLHISKSHSRRWQVCWFSYNI